MKSYPLMICLALVLVTTIARAQDTTAPIEEGQRVQLMAPKEGVAATTMTATTQAPTTAPAPSPATSGKVTTVTEKTTSKTYTVTKRRVGMVGYRAYPAQVEKVDGGMTTEKVVNGQVVSSEVLTPDPMLDTQGIVNGETNYAGPYEAYYTNSKGIRAIGPVPPTNVKVYSTGDFNN